MKKYLNNYINKKFDYRQCMINEDNISIFLIKKIIIYIKILLEIL